ncbi:hypothetical protein Sru01_35700 [Sphaerisporangium rufum]|uniref:Uncharacterized protein n=1 Tax=Sphaerisporangium rufum TaxID=1381558 RepID=A0A919R3F1_9ACTN|nr:hypothetical protein [Sphaerisporangium rufum]GII78588.1 hypothetical protein Sru01_35700 [Sphaerisporangium rufum]
MRVHDRSGRQPATTAARRLNRVLEQFGITAEVHEGQGIALVAICADLVAWTDGRCYFWWSGTVSSSTGRRVYNYCPADDTVTTARRLADRYAELRPGRPAPPPVPVPPVLERPAPGAAGTPPVPPWPAGAEEAS